MRTRWQGGGVFSIRFSVFSGRCRLRGMGPIGPIGPMRPIGPGRCRLPSEDWTLNTEYSPLHQSRQPPAIGGAFGGLAVAEFLGFHAHAVDHFDVEIGDRGVLL